LENNASGGISDKAGISYRPYIPDIPDIPDKPDKPDKVIIYTDGACSGNPGPGGWGSVLVWRQKERRLRGGADDTTNNRMELTAAIEALEALTRPCLVELYSDSAYLVNAFNMGWIRKWKANGWMSAKDKPVLNQDLWARLVRQDEIHRVSWRKVKGHSDDVLNAICDEMAVSEVRERLEARAIDDIRSEALKTDDIRSEAPEALDIRGEAPEAGDIHGEAPEAGDIHGEALEAGDIHGEALVAGDTYQGGEDG